MSPGFPKRRAVVVERARPWKVPQGSVPVSRGAMVDALLKEEHPLYVGGLKSLIVDVRAKEEGELDVECKVIDAIWNDPVYKLIGLWGKDSQEVTPGEWDDLTSARRDAIQAYVDTAQGLEEELQSLPDGDLARRYEQHLAAKQTEAAAQLREKGRKFDEGAFFNRRAAAADYAFWHRRAVWTAEEATALSFGKDPRHVNVKRLEAMGGLVSSPFREGFMERLDEVDRALKASLIKGPLTAEKLVEWARRSKIGIDSSTLDLLISPKKLRPEYSDDRSINTNRLHHMHQFIVGMMLLRNKRLEKEFRFDITRDSSQGQNKFFDELHDNLSSVDIVISKKTLKKIVEEAQKYMQDALHDAFTKARDKNFDSQGNARKTGTAE